MRYRCEWRGIGVAVDEIDINDEIDVSKYDFYFIGGGQDMQQAIVAKELKKHENALKDAAGAGNIFLGICGGYQLLGKYYQPKDAERLEGVNLLDAYTIAGDKRFISNVVAECDLVKSKTLVGFENHSGLTYLNTGTEPIAKIVVGNGNNGTDKTEGARKNNVFGTYLHGSFLPKNPEFADLLIKLALEKKYNDAISLTPLDDTIEMCTHKELLKKRF